MATVEHSLETGFDSYIAQSEAVIFWDKRIHSLYS